MKKEIMILDEKFPLHFIPEAYEREFIDEVWGIYQQEATHEMNSFYKQIPDVVTDIYVSLSPTFLLMGAMAIETGIDNAFNLYMEREMKKGMSEEDAYDQLWDYHTDTELYAENLVEDIEQVMQRLRVPHTTSIHQPLSGATYVTSLIEPVKSVW